MSKKLLVACEESQRVCKAFRLKGWEAYSCDIIECSGGHKEWHIQGDATALLKGNVLFVTQDGKAHYIFKWDLIIAHPPCTYLSNVGARHLRNKDGTINQERWAKAMDGKEFFLKFYNADCNHICVENPVPTKAFGLPPYTQIIQPYMFGEPVSKKTCLWLRNLPELKAENPVEPDMDLTQIWFDGYKIKDRQRHRSKTFKGIAKAMANQWSNIQ